MRKKWMEKELKTIVKKLILSYKPQKIILFGSFAKDDENPNDIDLLIIKDDVPFRGVDRVREVSSLFRHTIGVDTIVYKTSEVEDLLKFDPFIKQIMSKGRILYE